jgi:hypothetical protein
MDKLGVDEPVVADVAAASEKMLRILENCMVMVLMVLSLEDGLLKMPEDG